MGSPFRLLLHRGTRLAYKLSKIKQAKRVVSFSMSGHSISGGGYQVLGAAAKELVDGRVKEGYCLDMTSGTKAVDERLCDFIRFIGDAPIVYYNQQLSIEPIVSLAKERDLPLDELGFGQLQLDIESVQKYTFPELGFNQETLCQHYLLCTDGVFFNLRTPLGRAEFLATIFPRLVQDFDNQLKAKLAQGETLEDILSFTPPRR